MENIKIKKIPKEDRPRERLINKGVESLSTEELLAILLGSGTKNISVKNLSSLLLSKAGNLSNLKGITYHDLLKIKGIGEAKACIILSFIELSRRINKKTLNIKKTKIDHASKVFEYYKDKVSKTQEEFYCIYLDAKKRVIDESLLFKGTVNHSLVHPRDIFKIAYNSNSAFIICIHNHPSGDVIPSQEDIYVTERIKKIGNLMGIKLIDHVIVSTNNYYSFLENGQI